MAYVYTDTDGRVVRVSDDRQESGFTEYDSGLMSLNDYVTAGYDVMSGKTYYLSKDGQIGER